MYKTISYDQSEILHAINALYLSGEGIDLDPMYGKGGFYKKFPKPDYVGDIATLGIATDATNLEMFFDGSVRSMILDPPFMHAQGKDSAMRRYASYPSQKALHVLYAKLIREAYRVLVPGGILIFKNQDTVESGKQVWNHIWIYETARTMGFEALDLFVLLARSRVTGHNHRRQVHARRLHAYFWVFKKKRRPPSDSQRYVYLSDRDKRLPHQLDADGNVWVQLPMEVTNGP